jgi:3-hydroxyisobutyrate dehydrogenase-like beta-hydroxyacid dehydrogenase
VRVGWIGTGKLGLPMARRLRAAGHAVAAVDSGPAQRQAAAAAGLTVGGSIPALVEAAEVVVSTIPDDAALRAVAAELVPALGDGRLWVEMSTVAPAAWEAVRGAAGAAAARLVAAPVSGSTVAAEAGQLFVMVSGAPEAVARVRPLLAAFGPQVLTVGEGGEARYLKLAINHMVGSTAQLLAEALALGRSGGLDWRVMLDAIGASAVASPLVRYKLAPLLARDFAPAFTTRQMIKDMGLVAEACALSGVPAPLAGLVLERYRAQEAAGMGEDDFFAAVRLVERAAGLAEP